MENNPSTPKKLLQKVFQLILVGFSVLFFGGGVKLYFDLTTTRCAQEVEKVGDGLTEDWCSYTEKLGSEAVQTHSSRSQTIQRIRPIIFLPRNAL